MVALDWTDFDKDDPRARSRSTCSPSTAVRRRSSGKTVRKSELAEARNDHEDAVLGRLREVLPADVRVTVLADRGFGDQKLYRYLAELGFELRHPISRNRPRHVGQRRDEVGRRVGLAARPNPILAGSCGHQRQLRGRSGRLRPRQEHEGLVVPRHEPRTIERTRDRQPLRAAVHHRGRFPGREGHPLRPRAGGDTHRRPRHGAIVCC